MNQAPQNHSTAIIVAIITGMFLCIAAIIGAPFTKNLADRYIPTFTLVPTQTTSTIAIQETLTPVISETSSPIAMPIATNTNLGALCPSNPTDYPPINGKGQNIQIDSGDGYVHAVLWRPGGQIKEGYDEVSVLIEPGTKVTLIDVSGKIFQYYSNCPRAQVEAQIEQHNIDKMNDGKKVVTVDISEIQTQYP